MMNNLISVLVFSLFLSGNAHSYSQEQIDAMLLKASIANGVPLGLLSGIAKTESSMNPWALNINGEGYSFKSKRQLLETLTVIQQKQWLLKFKMYGAKQNSPHRRYFKTKKSAIGYAANLQRALSKQGRNNLKYAGETVSIERGEFSIRNLKVKSTDIGLMQVNFYHHAKEGQTVGYWLDMENNIDYAASFLSTLLKRHKNPIKAVAYYHSGTPKLQKIYIEKFLPNYKSELIRLTDASI
jgi:hypothetical protein